jgi:hypothetical protein
MRRFSPFAVPVLFAGLALCAVAGCSDEDPASSEPPISVDVYFNLDVDGAGLVRNSFAYTNAAGTIYSIQTLRFIISDLALHTDDGRTVPLKEVHFYDVSDASTQSLHATGLPHADYTRLTFTFGLDESKNVRDRYLHSYPALHAAMYWPPAMGPTLGYHYMQLEGDFKFSPDSTIGYTTHTGARQLDGIDPAPHHFFFAVDAPFTPTHIHEGGTGELEIHFNLNGWYADHLPADGFDSQYDFKDLPDQGIMDDLDAQGKLQANGAFCFSATLTATGGHDH